MNPLKWSVWIRIATVASVLWIGWVFADFFQEGFKMDAVAYLKYESSFPAYFYGIVTSLLPLILLWGIVWIIYRTRLWHVWEKKEKT